MQFLSVKEAIKWLKENATFDDPDLVINKQFLKKLNDTSRLMPDKVGIFGKKYSLARLEKYASEVKPR